MKKIILLLLLGWFCVSFSFAGGAQGSEAGTTDQVVTIKHLHYNPRPDAEKHFRGLVDKFNAANPNINIQLEMVPWSNYFEKLMTSVSGGMAPDTAMVQPVWIRTFQAQKALAPLDGFFKAWPFKDDIEQSVVPNIRSMSDDGKLYTLPFILANYMIYYRKDLFAAENLQPPKTMDEFLEATQKLTKDTDGDGKVDQYGFTIAGAMYAHEGWFSFIYSDLKNPSHRIDGKLTLQLPEVVAKNQMYIDLFSKYKVVPPTAPSDTNNEMFAYLATGKAAMLVHHIGPSAMLQEELGENFGVMPMPVGKYGKRFVSLGANGLAVFAASDHQDQAFKWISWLIEPDQHRGFADTNQTMVFLNSLVDEFKSRPVHAISFEQLPDSEFLPDTPYMGEFAQKIWPDLYSKAIFGKISSEEMMKQVRIGIYGE